MNLFYFATNGVTSGQLMPLFWEDLAILEKTVDCRKRNNFLQTYKNVDDRILQWLGNTFLNHFIEWKENIEARTGTFTKTEKAQMFISSQTYEGFQITCQSISDACLSF